MPQISVPFNLLFCADILASATPTKDAPEAQPYGLIGVKYHALHDWCVLAKNDEETFCHLWVVPSRLETRKYHDVYRKRNDAKSGTTMNGTEDYLAA